MAGMTKNNTVYNQMKALSAANTSTGIIADLTFNNIVIGKWYKVSGVINVQEYLTSVSDKYFYSYLRNGNTVIARLNWRNNSQARMHHPITIHSLFKATETDINFYVSSNSDLQITGNGTSSLSHLIVEELPNHEETIKWS